MTSGLILIFGFAVGIVAGAGINEVDTYNLTLVRSAPETMDACFGTHDVEFHGDVSLISTNIRQLNALLDFFNSTGGDSWVNRDGWGVGDPCRDFWFGLECDCEGNVIAIRLPDNHLNGYIPPSIANLTALRLVDLHTSIGSGSNGNSLSGSVPALGGISSLSSFDVSGNRLNSVDSADSISTSLQSLCASRNDFGSLPWNLSRLTELRVLDLSDSNIEAVFPSSDVCNMTQIYFISLANNTITGNFFDECLLDLDPLVVDVSAYIPTKGSRGQGLTGDVPLSLISKWNNINQGYISFYLQPLIGGHFAAVCADTRFCLESNFRTHGDLAWAQLTDIPSYVYETIGIAQIS